MHSQIDDQNIKGNGLILALELYGLGVNLFLIFHDYVLTFLAEIWLRYQIVQREVYTTVRQPLLGKDGNLKPQPRPSIGPFPHEGYHGRLNIVTDKLLPLPSQISVSLCFQNSLSNSLETPELERNYILISLHL